MVAGDSLVLLAAAVVAFVLISPTGGMHPVLIAGLLATTGVVALHAQHLYRARVAAVRSVETVGLLRTSLLLAVLALLAVRDDSGSTWERALLVLVLAFTGLVTFRWGYRTWLANARSQGRYLRRVVLVGDNDEAKELAVLLADHGELGLELAGVVRTAPGGLRPWIRVPTANGTKGALDLMREVDANGVVIAVTALRADECNRLVRELLAAGAHVHYSAGLRGIDVQRMRPLPLAHEPMFYVEPTALGPWQARCKRAIDVVGSAACLVLVSPFIALAAIAIKLDDRGPVFFRQRRIGLRGDAFEMVKLRSMTRAAVLPHPSTGLANEREGGPLFKMANDPRRSRVGRILERTSLDEVPQLWNVLKGDMSLVGPRPALPSEVAEFDTELQARHNVRPGITGLWQLEARDNPSFRAYKRLDIFYIENWSVALDIAIIAGTIEKVAARVCSWRSWIAPKNADPDEMNEEIVLGTDPPTSIAPATPVAAIPRAVSENVDRPGGLVVGGG